MRDAVTKHFQIDTQHGMEYWQLELTVERILVRDLITIR